MNVTGTFKFSESTLEMELNYELHKGNTPSGGNDSGGG